MQNLKPLASPYSWAGQFQSYLVGNLEDRFSRDETHIVATMAKCLAVLISFGFISCHCSQGLSLFGLNMRKPISVWEIFLIYSHTEWELKRILDFVLVTHLPCQ